GEPESPCPACGTMISSDAMRCYACGHRMSSDDDKGKKVPVSVKKVMKKKVIRAGGRGEASVRGASVHPAFHAFFGPFSSTFAHFYIREMIKCFPPYSGVILSRENR